MAIKAPAPRSGDGGLFDVVADAVDLRKCYPRSDEARDFGRYFRDRCIGPDHQDSAPSMLVFHNGVQCTACGYKRSTLGAMFDLRGRQGSIVTLAQELMGGPFDYNGDAPRSAGRKLDEDRAVDYHIRLLRTPEAYAKVRAMGFTDDAIAHWKLGLHTVGVRVSPDGQEPPEYENQDRIVFPVFEGGALRQLLYRKLDNEQRGMKIQMEKDAGSWLINRDALAGASLVVICEGWGDVIALWQLGITAVSSTNGAGHWNSEWNDDLLLVKQLYASGDADQAGAKLIDRVRKTLFWARPVRPPFAYGSKGDWRDWVLAGGTREQFLRMLRRAPMAVATERLARYA
jgi:hypothetical protein